MEQKLAFTRKEAAASIGVSLPTLDGFIKRRARPISVIRVGRKVLIPVDALRMWLERESGFERTEYDREAI